MVIEFWMNQRFFFIRNNTFYEESVDNDGIESIKRSDLTINELLELLSTRKNIRVVFDEDDL